MVQMVPTSAGPRLKPHYAGLRFTVREGGWRIDAGIGRYLVAEGSGFSLPTGRALFRDLQRAAMARRAKPRRVSP